MRTLPLALAATTTLVVANEDAERAQLVSAYILTWSYVILGFFLIYSLVALASWPYVRYRTGMPFLFLFLILLFPPSFFFLLFYLLLLRIGCLATAWYVIEEEELERRRQAQRPRSATRSSRSSLASRV